MKKSLRKVVTPSKDINAFLKQVQDMQTMTTHGNRPGRLAFIIDATASRQPTWDHACRIQGEMFRAVRDIGRLQVQLGYFRGISEFHTSAWIADSDALLHEMSGVNCIAGQTQIYRALKHLLTETLNRPVAAAVYIGDACEEPSAGIFGLAGQIGIHKTPVFMFQENNDRRAAEIYETVARLSGGAYCRFDETSADLLAELLSAVAVYATGGRQALEAFAGNGTPQLQQLTKQLLP